MALSTLPQHTKIQVAQHLVHGGSMEYCCRKFQVSEKQAQRYAKQYEEGSLFKKGSTGQGKHKHYQWQSHWELSSCVHHPLDADVHKAATNGIAKCEDELIGLFDPELDAVNGLYHLQWTDEDLEKLHLGMLDRSLEVIRNSNLDSDTYVEEMAFISGNFCRLICQAYGFDHENLREGVALIDYDRRNSEENETEELMDAVLLAELDKEIANDIDAETMKMDGDVDRIVEILDDDIEAESDLLLDDDMFH